MVLTSSSSSVSSSVSAPPPHPTSRPFRRRTCPSGPAAFPPRRRRRLRPRHRHWNRRWGRRRRSPSSRRRVRLARPRPPWDSPRSCGPCAAAWVHRRHRRRRRRGAWRTSATRRADGIIAPVTRITQSTRLLFDIDAPRVDAPASEADARRHCIAETVVTGARGAVTACIILSRQRARVWCGPDVGKSFC